MADAGVAYTGGGNDKVGVKTQLSNFLTCANIGPQLIALKVSLHFWAVGQSERPVGAKK